MAFAPPLNQKFSGKYLYVNPNEGMIKNYSNFSKNRDISPFRKYTNNNFKKSTTKKNFYNNNIHNGNNNNFIKKITSPLSLNRSKSPNTPSILNKNINKNANNFNKKKFNNNNNYNNTNKIIRTPNIRSPNSISVNNSSKKLTPKITKNLSLSPYNIRNNNKLNSSNLLNNKSLNNIKNKTFINNNNNKKRSTTPVSKTKFSLNYSNSNNNLKFNKTKKFNNNNFLPNRTNSPFGFKNNNNLNNRNSFSNNIKNQNRINYQNNFRSMNIFKGFSNKNKPNNFIFSFNMNQQEKNINGNNNIIIDNDNGLPKNISNMNNINNNNNSTNNNNRITNNINNNITSTIIKNIKCMHDMSKTGYAGEDEKKINQDNYFVFHNFAGNTNYIFMSVCDGHGQVGQEISNYLKENLPISLNKKIKEKKINILTTNINNIIKETFLEENNNLSSNEMINSMLSGSTCVSVIYTPYKLITANVGDSRAFMGRFISNNEWKAIDLTRDHKPDLPDEKKRILSNNGVIEPMKDDDGSFIGPNRVWLKNEDYPGLAMSRSFGDKVAHSVGVSAEPEIKEYLFDKNDKFFIVASDGLFEFMSSQEIVNIVKDYYLNGDIVSCCEDLYKMSCEKWMKEEEVIDDITIILVFLEDEYK